MGFRDVEPSVQTLREGERMCFSREGVGTKLGPRTGEVSGHSVGSQKGRELKKGACKERETPRGGQGAAGPHRTQRQEGSLRA